MKADLLTYPLPYGGRSNKFGLNELVSSAMKSGIDLIGVIGFTSRYDNPDHRFKDFWEDRKSLSENYKITPYTWDDSTNVLTAFSTTSKTDGKIVTFLYGNNGDLLYLGQSIRLLRIGLDFKEKPHRSGEDLEKVLNQANSIGALTLISPLSIALLERFEKIPIVNRVYWNAQSIFNEREYQDSLDLTLDRLREEKNIFFSVVPVSNAHMPYLGKPASNELKEIGRSYIEFEGITWKYGKELVGQLKEIIDSQNFNSHREYSPLSSIFQWKWRMFARKSLRELGYANLDYKWSSVENAVPRV